MADVIDLEVYRPDMTVYTESGDVHVVPVRHLQEYIAGTRPLERIAGEDSDEVVRALLKHYLSLFGSGW